MITATHVSLALGGNLILNDLSLTIRPHASTVILGANGAGKSTLMSCLTGDRAPDQGTVAYGDTPLSDLTSLHLAQRRAVLSQSIAVTFPFTAFEVVRMGRQPFEDSLRPTDNDAIAEEALRRVGGWSLRDRIFPTLSGGEKQRIHLARVMAQIWQQKDGILFLDEPNAALDLRFQMELMELVDERVKTHGLTVVMILHDVLLARRKCHYAILLKAGKILSEGPAEAEICNSTISEVYDYPGYDLLPV